ncbi:unnamed protein product [Gongylonema pulchrum]|uniref:Chloride channel CLIC-like protein 1 n=1 Tax=Gongylonema pulchrum TaxID=637853 RepID=A0A183DQI5_9BILA|nr:unnamed protein product [Gongylonema pulchrum]
MHIVEGFEDNSFVFKPPHLYDAIAPAFKYDESYTDWSNFPEKIKSVYDEVTNLFLEENTVAPAPKLKLSAQTLRNDLRRCGLHLHVPQRVCTYMFYNGYLYKTILLLTLLQLFANYVFYQKGIDLRVTFLPRVHIDVPHLELTGIGLIFDIAFRVQTLLSLMAKILEKVHNLFMWKSPRTTAEFCALIGFFFAQSLFFSTCSCLSFIGLLVAFKTFISAYFYHRFPKLRQKLDLASYFYVRIPTNYELDMRTRRLSRKFGSQDEMESIRISPTIVRKMNMFANAEVKDGSVASLSNNGTPKCRIPAFKYEKRRSSSCDSISTAAKSACSYRCMLTSKDFRSQNLKYSICESLDDEAPEIVCIASMLIPPL